MPRCCSSSAGVRLLTDPLLRGRLGPLRRRAPPPRRRAALTARRGPDLAPAPRPPRPAVAAAAAPGRPLIVPAPGRGASARAGLRRGASSWRRARRTRVGGVDVTAVDAAATRAGAPRRPDAQAIGFLLDGRGARLLRRRHRPLRRDGARSADRLDVALLPVWGWGPTLGAGHLDPERRRARRGAAPPADRRPDPLGHAALDRRRGGATRGRRRASSPPPSRRSACPSRRGSSRPARRCTA